MLERYVVVIIVVVVVVVVVVVFVGFVHEVENILMYEMCIGLIAVLFTACHTDMI